MTSVDWSRKLAVTAVSTVILAVLLLQSAVSLVFYPIVHSLSHTWPFLDYPMYSGPNYQGDRIRQLVLFGARPDLPEVQIAPEDLGLGFWHFQKFLEKLRDGDRRTARELARLYESMQKAPITALRLEGHDLVLGRSGAVPAEPRVLRQFPLTEEE